MQVGISLTAATVTGIDPTVGHFQYQAIPDLILTPGTYVIAGQYLGNGGDIPLMALGVTTQPGFTWITDEQSSGAGLNFPDTSTGGLYGNNGLLAVDFATTHSSVTPEPAEFLPMAIIGIGIGLALVLRRKARPAVQ